MDHDGTEGPNDQPHWDNKSKVKPRYIIIEWTAKITVYNKTRDIMDGPYGEARTVQYGATRTPCSPASA